MEHLTTCWHNTNEMPYVLRVLCRGAMVVGPIMLLFLVLPIAPWDVNGNQMSYAELWTSGVGEVIALLFGLVTVGAWGMAARNAFSRWFIVLSAILPAPLFMLIPAFARGLPGVSTAAILLQAAVTAGLFYVCLFRLSSVTKYFGDGRSTE